MKYIQRNWQFAHVKVSHPTLAREPISKEKLTALLTAFLGIKFKVFTSLLKLVQYDLCLQKFRCTQIQGVLRDTANGQLKKLLIDESWFVDSVSIDAVFVVVRKRL